VLELLGEARPEDLVVRIDTETPEDLVSCHPPARLAVVAALLVREQGLNAHRVNVKLAHPGRSEVEIVYDEWPHLGKESDPLAVDGPRAFALRVANVRIHRWRSRS